MKRVATRKIDFTKMALYAAAGVTAIALGLSLGLLLMRPQAASIATRGGAFELVGADGAAVNESVLEGSVSLIYFGFTYCPDYCPTELANLVAAEEALEAQGVDTQIVFISIDPERDTPEVMGEYTAFFDADIVGLTGTEVAIAAAARAYRVVYFKNESPDLPDGYLMNHTTEVYATDANGDYLMKFAAFTAPDEIAAQIVNATSGS